jgi:plastocyanin
MKSWNSRRALVATALGAILLTAAGSALAAGGKGPAKAKELIVGEESIKPNTFYKSTLHFQTGTVTIRSGGTVTLINNTADPHTLSLVKASQQVRTFRQLENCAVCQTIAKSHGINTEGPPTQGPPPIRLVNVGAPGFDTPGDSVIIGPKGHGGPVTLKITARPGTTLYFMCAIHPWMQGRFLVK